MLSGMKLRTGCVCIARESTCVRVCVRACVRVCARVCVRAYVRARVRVHVSVRVKTSPVVALTQKEKGTFHYCK